MTPIGNIGQRLDLQLRKGADDLLAEVTLTDSNGDPIDLTAAQLRASVYRNGAKLCDLTCTPTDATAGVFQISMTHDQSATLLAATPLGSTVRHDWGCDATLASGDVLPVLYGQAAVTREPA